MCKGHETPENIEMPESLESLEKSKRLRANKLER